MLPEIAGGTDVPSKYIEIIHNERTTTDAIVKMVVKDLQPAYTPEHEVLNEEE